MKTLLIAILLFSSSAMAQNYGNHSAYEAQRPSRNSNPVGKEISEGRDYLQTMKQQNQRYIELDNALTTRKLINGNSVGSSSGHPSRNEYFGY